MSSAAQKLEEGLRAIAREEAQAALKAERSTARYDLVAHTELPPNLARQARAAAHADPETLPAFKEGSVTYFQRGPLDRWLEARRIGAKPAPPTVAANDATAPAPPAAPADPRAARRARLGLAPLAVGGAR